MSRPAVSLYAFGSFRLDATAELLQHDGVPVPLTQKQFETLLLLVRNSGRLLHKDELMELIWSDACVEPANLTQTIFVLRKLLAQHDPESQYIETAPRRGYRFVAPVEEVRDDSVRPAVAKNSSTGSHGDDRQYNSLAVLPFANATSDPNAEYLSDGLTESIINSLSQLKGLRVLGRNTVFRYKGATVDPQEIGAELGVRSVLTGRILQLGDRVVIRAEVTDVVGGWQVWGEQYHRKPADILAVQEEIAEEISDRLKLKLTVNEKRQLTKRYTDNSEAYHLYLKGRYHWNKYAEKGLGKAIEYFKEALDEDPTYALAYAGIADSYYRLSNFYLPTRETMPKAKVAALKALEIDEGLAEAHAALGLVLMFYDWDWKGAEREFSRAIELNPGYAIAHQRLALSFILRDHFDEAMHELQLAVELDPLSLQIPQSMAFVSFLKGNYEEAIHQIEKTLEMNGNYHPLHYLLGWVYKRTGETAKALECFARVAALDDSPNLLGALGHGYGINGDRARALEVLDQLEEQSKRRYVSSYCRALVHLGLDEKDKAFYWLDKAFEERSEMLPWLNIAAEYDSIRADSRFLKLLRRVGLPRTSGFKLQSAAS